MGAYEAFGGEEHALGVAETLRELIDSGGLQGLESGLREEAVTLRQDVESAIRSSAMSAGSFRGSARGGRSIGAASSLILN